MTLTKQLQAAAAAIAVMEAAGPALAQAVNLTIESWRTEDAAIWQDEVIPAFEDANPGITVTFAPTDTSAYDTALSGRLEAGTAGDLIMCRPYAPALDLQQKGYLAQLDLPQVQDLPAAVRAAWSTDDQATTFCLPMAVTLYGFIYNRDIFERLGLSAPRTVAEFHDVLQKLRANGSATPLAMATGELWDAATAGYQNIGPTYWRGEAGRLALLAGKQKLTDENWVAPFRELARWKDYLGAGFEAQTYSDSQNLFTLGRAAIYPAGSWEIAGLVANAPFALGAFPPPVQAAEDKCYILERPEMGIAINAASPNIEAAKAFLRFVASTQFGEIEANALPGLFPADSHPVTIEEPLAQEFASWRGRCESTVRTTDGILSRGSPSFEDEIRKAVAQVIKGAEAPEIAGARLQAGLDAWYRPEQ